MRANDNAVLQHTRHVQLLYLSTFPIHFRSLFHSFKIDVYRRIIKNCYLNYLFCVISLILCTESNLFSLRWTSISRTHLACWIRIVIEKMAFKTCGEIWLLPHWNDTSYRISLNWVHIPLNRVKGQNVGPSQAYKRTKGKEIEEMGQIARTWKGGQWRWLIIKLPRAHYTNTGRLL